MFISSYLLSQKQKMQKEIGTDSDLHVSQQPTKVIHQFPQKRPVADNTTQSKPQLSKDILAGLSAIWFLHNLVCTNNDMFPESCLWL